MRGGAGDSTIYVLSSSIGASSTTRITWDEMGWDGMG